MTSLVDNAVLGSHIIWKVRPYSKRTEQAATKLALQLDGNLSGSGTTNRKQTKETTITSRGRNEFTVDITYVASRDEVNQEIYDTFLNEEELEMWRIDTGDTTEETVGEEGNQTTVTKYKATYVRGYINSYDMPDNVDDTVDSSTTLDVTYGPVDGTVELTQDDINKINTAFTFQDTAKVEVDLGE